eukprot:CAMPEP_0174363014 /NCGR_PEP_ID=MMETSP0811_2-20130205/66986_1 /TAXON_ID=73025 ORGANISM="Eutreptiella gymnastica-like, Strain CCMP1594" /NCGR_SAMPLE_ID=MMETSP0811_2 /ASSEMBLY_ACC=CAM_ASM_000667 /LENGTH=48 /DNA_ID= /DNA_START= /DNA_END= /DNA_ORIENTATION=
MHMGQAASDRRRGESPNAPWERVWSVHAMGQNNAYTFGQLRSQGQGPA